MCTLVTVSSLTSPLRSKSKMMKLFFLLLSVLCFVNGQTLIQKQKLRFKISARNLQNKDNIGKTGPYVELFYIENENAQQVKFGQSETVIDTVNPNWGTTFDFDYDRSKGQRWRLQVKDHDNGREDDTVVGSTWVIVDDYVDGGQKYTVSLDKGGSLTLENDDLISILQQYVPVTPFVIPIVQPLQESTPVPATPRPSSPRRLRIKLWARGLPDTDIFGTIDPYVKAFYTDESTKLDRLFGRTDFVKDNQNPNFKENLEFDYVEGKKQKWHFLILDNDDNRRDDSGGEAFLDVEEYVKMGESAVLTLNNGLLFVTKA